MSDTHDGPALRSRSVLTRSETTNLADILERILDKGIVIAGDIAVNLVDIELLTIKIRLLIASVDKAREIGIDWWSSDPWLSSEAAEKQARHSKGSGGREGGSRSFQPERTAGDGREEIEARLERIESVLERLAGELPARAQASPSLPKTGDERQSRSRPAGDSRGG
jgi:hypothetical protein